MILMATSKDYENSQLKCGYQRAVHVCLWPNDRLEDVNFSWDYIFC
jgi:hypothetical protein